MQCVLSDRVSYSELLGAADGSVIVLADVDAGAGRDAVVYFVKQSIAQVCPLPQQCFLCKSTVIQVTREYDMSIRKLSIFNKLFKRQSQ